MGHLRLEGREVPQLTCRERLAEENYNVFNILPLAVEVRLNLMRLVLDMWIILRDARVSCENEQDYEIYFDAWSSGISLTHGGTKACEM